MKHVLLTILICLVSTTAYAQSETLPAPDDCGGCDAGEVCVTLEEADCPPCPGDGSECETCASGEISRCEPAPPAECNSDSDCGAGTVCADFNYSECDGGDSPEPVEPCDPDGGEGCSGGDTDPDQPGTDDGNSGDPGVACQTYTESYCVPPYILGCELDADCGAGFTCEQTEICECSAGAPSEDGEPNQDPDCSCRPSGDAQCQIVPTECSGAADCIDGWSCESAPDEPTCRSIGQEDGEEDVDCGGSDPAPSVDYCIPPAYEVWASGGVDGVSRATGNDDSLESASRTEFFPVDSNSNGAKADADGGCSTTSGNGSGFALLLLGLFAFARRRRQER